MRLHRGVGRVPRMANETDCKIHVEGRGQDRRIPYVENIQDFHLGFLHLLHTQWS